MQKFAEKAAMGFRVFRVVVIEVTRQKMAKNGRKWISARFSSIPYYYR